MSRPSCLTLSYAGLTAAIDVTRSASGHVLGIYRLSLVIEASANPAEDSRRARAGLALHRAVYRVNRRMAYDRTAAGLLGTIPESDAAARALLDVMARSDPGGDAGRRAGS
ncbi:hypothetical protein [Marinicauda sp. Alg238-R41]|uniref:hypothetical protein n=1 Tax=Marinicauda sp. Alg238-R41 TaxID=2993447 RepID=UPI0022E76B07|nr:hypothetical protein [Marinicauda sp. Alg238-R41]